MKHCCFTIKLKHAVSATSVEYKELKRDYKTLEEEYENKICDTTDSNVSGTAEGDSAAASSTEAFNNEANRKKNRYQNIPCWDHSRVVLSKSGSAPGCDYIHANYVDGYCWKKKFVATQAPMSRTVVDFFNMIWQNDCKIIVVLASMLEDQQNKMYPYWSTVLGNQIHGEYVVWTRKVDNLGDYQKYFLEIGSTATKNDCRKVSLYHYADWAAQGAPKNIEGFLAFVLAINGESVNNLLKPPVIAAPIVVHCNAGTGRTGTYCVIDICLEQWLTSSQLSVLDTVRRVRYARHSSVGNAKQYAFIFRILKAAIKYDVTY